METNSIVYKTSRTMPHKKIEVKIRLNDEYKNGHADFAITGTVYEKDKWGNWKWSSCGCCHDEILKVFKKFKPFIDLHLCDAIGVPMYAVGNGRYHLRESSRKVVMEYLRITDEEYDYFKAHDCDDQFFKYQLYKKGIVARWKEEAASAIAYLESLSGQKFKDESTRYQIDPLTDGEILLVETRIAEGYYTKTAIEKRRLATIRDANRKRGQKLRHRAQEAKKKIDQKLSVELYLLKMGIPDSGYIYYDHTNRVEFNWTKRFSIAEIVTEEQYSDFLNRVDYSKLPKGISFTLKSA